MHTTSSEREKKQPSNKPFICAFKHFFSLLLHANSSFSKKKTNCSKERSVTSNYSPAIYSLPHTMVKRSKNSTCSSFYMTLCNLWRKFNRPIKLILIKERSTVLSVVKYSPANSCRLMCWYYLLFFSHLRLCFFHHYFKI